MRVINYKDFFRGFKGIVKLCNPAFDISACYWLHEVKIAFYFVMQSWPWFEKERILLIMQSELINILSKIPNDILIFKDSTFVYAYVM